VADFIAGMTNLYAMNFFRKALSSPLLAVLNSRSAHPKTLAMGDTKDLLTARAIIDIAFSEGRR
jgi:hypothetical protein